LNPGTTVPARGQKMGYSITPIFCPPVPCPQCLCCQLSTYGVKEDSINMVNAATFRRHAMQSVRSRQHNPRRSAFGIVRQGRILTPYARRIFAPPNTPTRIALRRQLNSVFRRRNVNFLRSISRQRHMPAEVYRNIRSFF